jgi:type IV pilus assembly protein PilO
MAQLLTQVTVAGQRSGVEFLLFEPRPPAPRDIYVENPVQVKVNGGYHEIGMFLSRTSNLPRIINVNSIELKNAPNKDDPDAPDVVEATLHMAAYTLLSEEQRAAQQAAAQAGKPVVVKPKGGRSGGH